MKVVDSRPPRNYFDDSPLGIPGSLRLSGKRANVDCRGKSYERKIGNGVRYPISRPRGVLRIGV
jgi:hypothetical protein